MGEALDHEKIKAVLDPVDACSQARNALRHIAREANEYAGLPMQLEGGAQLVIEPGYAYAKLFNKEHEVDPAETRKVRNRFYCRRRKAEIVIFERDGKLDWGWVPRANQFLFQMNTMDVSAAWGLEQEATALQLLGTMINHNKFKQYLLTGTFVEISKKSRVLYVFRKLRPTLAVSLSHPDGEMRLLCALCLHPIGFYEESWAGAMCPTDDVIAHLSLMRGDEKYFWKKSTQHPAWSPNAGI